MEREQLRNLIHDLLHSQHAIHLNVKAAIHMAQNLDGENAARLQRFLQTVLTKVQDHEDQLKQVKAMLTEMEKHS